MSEVLPVDAGMNERAEADIGADIEVGAGEPAVNAADMHAAAIMLLTVGQKLRIARVAANLSAADVAQTLKFSQRQIELLEADNYAALPGNTIVRGFVRSYARFLKLDPEGLLRMLDERSPIAPADVRPPENMGTASEAGDFQRYTPAVSVVIVISFAAVLLGLWHFFGPSVTKPATGPSGSERQSKLPDIAPNAAPAPVAAVSQSSESAVTPPLTQAPVANTAPVLLFVFNGRSWLEVSDTTGQKLHSGENPAGSQLTLSGRPPFEIVVGNAERVKLTYGERVIDLAPYTRADVARLKLE